MRGADIAKPTCSIDGCETKVYGRGWCSKHYQRWYKHGDPLGEASRPSDADRFWAKVDVGHPLGCWIWTGYRLPGGYGQFGYGGRGGPKPLAHRYAYQLLVGPIPDGLQLDHMCRNRSCVNPDHLEPVTHKVNGLRGESPNAKNARKYHCVRGHAFTPKNTYVYWRNGHRQCRTCKALRERKVAA